MYDSFISIFGEYEPIIVNNVAYVDWSYILCVGLFGIFMFCALTFFARAVFRK